jgi:hypothetical protein
LIIYSAKKISLLIALSLCISLGGCENYNLKPDTANITAVNDVKTFNANCRFNWRIQAEWDRAATIKAALNKKGISGAKIETEKFVCQTILQTGDSITIINGQRVATTVRWPDYLAANGKSTFDIISKADANLVALVAQQIQTGKSVGKASAYIELVKTGLLEQQYFGLKNVEIK